MPFTPLDTLDFDTRRRSKSLAEDDDGRSLSSLRSDILSHEVWGGNLLIITVYGFLVEMG
jgi:hypothetical protein